jgi:hypothetical protein
MTRHFTRDKLYYFRRTLTHPADSFYEIRHREFGSVPLALITVALFSLCYTLDRIFAGFIVNTVDPRSVDGFVDLQGVVVIFLLFCVGNWSVTCLMSGEGRFKDIVVVTGYSLMPLIFTYIPAIIVSNVIAANEEVFYSIIISFGIIWTAILILMGIMTVHNYSLLKTIITLVITVLSMLIIVFLTLLLLDLLNQVFTFFYGIYTELILRG